MLDVEDVFTNYLAWAPTSLAIREVSRIRAFKVLDQKIDLFKANRILDVGCGDGHWWLSLIPGELHKVHGVDISPKEVELAKSVIWARSVDVASPEFSKELENKKFDLVVGNCSIEHVYHLDKALSNIYDVLEPNGKFVLFVPTPYWALKGKSVNFLDRISPRLSMGFAGLLNGFFQHWHLYHYRIWESVLQNFKFRNVRAYGLGNKKSEFLFRLFLPSAFVSFLVKVITGKYLNYFIHFILPKFLLRKWAHYLAGTLDDDLRAPNDQEIFEYVLVCEK